VLYVTGYADFAGAEQRTGDDPLIKKPFRLAQLRSEVRRAMRKPQAGAGRNVVTLRSGGGGGSGSGHSA